VATAALAASLPILQTAPLATAATATATAQGRGPQGVFLTVSGSRASRVRGITLYCEPRPHGRHPRAAKACAALDKARGDFRTLPGARGFCTLQHDPVTVAAHGSHRGRAVNWRKTFPNACAMHRATGPVFDF
jgi:hypothetical protein